ncbi:MAG: hypothetical protein ABEH38_07315 [Flavobacteriales bacterium]
MGKEEKKNSSGKKDNGAMKAPERSKNFISIPPPIYKWRSVPKNQKEREAIISGSKGKEPQGDR